ncbi:predicted redox protein, regulator of disulfide bond formation [Solibacillus silvestris StLB046]|uniref:Predicted redox protein, regulator of disulfide bond formation n=2 Tax=Solibacillus TaxID=648800 RepID=F2FA59_SOLSS|nr:predicted redox protein, regulator of disulfide bond formation [Solibacillus silvestris StLB046]
MLHGKLIDCLQQTNLRIEEFQMNITQTLDAKGLACPMPIVKTKKAIDKINSGEVLEVLVTDKGALNDFKAWAGAGGHTIVEQKEEAGVLYFYIQKA